MGGIVGPPFVDALVSMLGESNVAVQGVNNYPADVAGFQAGGSATGSQDAADLIALALKKCPRTKLCVSGYRCVSTYRQGLDAESKSMSSK